MHEPLTNWFCDRCGEVIENIDAGHVVWRRDQDLREYDFSIIHRTCDVGNQFPCWEELRDFVGSDGLSELLSFVSLGPFISQPGVASTRGPADNDQFVDLIRRVQLPYYEEARQYFSREGMAERMAGENEVAPYRVERLRELIAKFELNDDTESDA